MTDTERALHRISNRSPEEIGVLVDDLLSGKTAVVGMGGGWDEQPEDFLAAVLRSPQTPGRRAVVDACIRWLARLVGAAVDSTREFPNHLEGGLTPLAAALSLAKPPELKPHILASLTFTVLNPDLDFQIRAALVQVAVSYASPGDDFTVWKSVLKDAALAAYAISAMMQIDPFKPDVLTGLKALWIKALKGESDVAVSDLTRRLAKARGSGDWVVPFLVEICDNAPTLRLRLDEELRRSGWSIRWAIEIEDAFEAKAAPEATPDPRFSIVLQREHQIRFRNTILSFAPEVSYQNIIRRRHESATA